MHVIGKAEDGNAGQKNTGDGIKTASVVQMQGDG